MHDPQRAATLAALRDLRALLATPERWTQGANGRNVAGRSVEPEAGDAVCWCLVGGGYRIGTPHIGWSLVPLVGRSDIGSWNDSPSRTHADVLALIDAAIERECRAVGA